MVPEDEGKNDFAVLKLMGQGRFLQRIFGDYESFL